jgi:electron-transferring-flavoprotein dehydrogenase
LAETDRIQYNLLLVGGSTTNLALAHQLVSLAKQSGQPLSIALLEKGREFGSHIVSGAVTHPHVIQKLFPNYETNGFPLEGVCTQSTLSIMGSRNTWDVPRSLMPEEFRKEGYLILTLSHVIAWMAQQLKEAVKDAPHITLDVFPGFAAHDIIYEGERVAGVRVSHTENPMDDYVYADVTVFADKGFLSRDLIDRFGLRRNPQIWSVGVKEVWEIPGDLTGKVWHTMGYPVLDGTFGGGFVYGMKNNRLTIGLVISLDSKNPNINPQQRLQDYKKHPWLQRLIQEGRLLKYGAALLPEGGYYALPSQFAVDGAMILGDALGTLNPRRLRGVDMAMECGYQAATVLHQAFQKGDYTASLLNTVQQRLNKTFVIQDLYESRYFRQAFIENPRLLGEYLPNMAQAIDSSGSPYGGMIKTWLHQPLQSLMDAVRVKRLFDGKANLGDVTYQPCHQHIDPRFVPAVWGTPMVEHKETLYSRADAVFYANTRYHEHSQHIDEFDAAVCVQCIGRYDMLGRETPCIADCTAEVHRVDVIQEHRQHGMSLENCIQCRTCEIVCPETNLRVNPAEEGSGPDFLGL